MVRIGDSPPRRGSPSEVFSEDINDIHRRSKQEKTDGCTRTMAILCAILATMFLISTVVLAVVVATKGNDLNTESSTLQGLQSNEPNINQIGGGPGGLIYNPDELNGNRQGAPQANSLEWPTPSGSLYGHFKKAAIASDNGLCSEIGRDILMEGGNAVEAMIAALVCTGVVNPQSSGLGGGFMMTLYNASTGRCQTINARETAPGSSYPEMFSNNSKESVTGYRSIATPSELHGYWTVYNRFGSGKVTWSRLFQDSVRLALNGFPVTSNLAMVLADKEKEILAEPTMKEIFIDPATHRVYEEGDIMKRKTLGFTLQLIANSSDPVDLFYKGGMAQTIGAEITDNGGHVDLSDLSKYETLIEDSPLTVPLLNDFEMCGPPPPSSFAITQSIIAVMAEFYNDKSVDLNDPLVYHRLIEAEKFAYAQRTKLGDVAFVESSKAQVANMTTNKYAKWIASLVKDKAQPQDYYMGGSSTQADINLEEVPDHGTSHVTVIDEYGNAVSTTSTINQLLGSMRASPTLGIIWNDEMDDFSTPGVYNAFGFAPSDANFIAPGKRPMSSMSPMIVYNKNDQKVELVTGGAGGSFIISATAQTVIRSLLFNQTVKAAVDAPRFHNQFLPHVTQFERKVPKKIVDALINEFNQNMSAIVQQKSVIHALEVQPDGFIHANSDFRRVTATYPAGF